MDAIAYTQDSIVNSVIADFIERSNLGVKKYGKTLDRDDLTFTDWIKHMQEELMDAILYLQKIKEESQKTNETYEKKNN